MWKTLAGLLKGLVGLRKWLSGLLTALLTALSNCGDEAIAFFPFLPGLFTALSGLAAIIGAACLAHQKNTEKMNRMGQVVAFVGGAWCAFAWGVPFAKWIFPVFGILGLFSFKVIVLLLHSRRKPSPEVEEKEDV